MAEPSPTTEPEPAVGERRDARRVFLTALLLYGAFVWPFEGEIPNRYVDLARAMVEERTFAIDRHHTNTSDVARVGSHFYVAAAPGPALVGAPAYAAARAVGGSVMLGQAAMTFVVGPLAGAAAAMALFLLTGRIAPGSMSRGERLWLVGAYAAGTFALPLATALYAHTLAALLALGSLLAIQRHAVDGAPRNAALAGLLAGALPLCEYPAAIVVPALAAWLWLARPGAAGERARRLLLFAAGAAAPAALLAAYHTACFGAPWRTGYAFHREEAIRVIQATGVAGFSAPSLHTLVETTVGTCRGLLVFAPPVVVSLLAAPGALRAHAPRVVLGVGVGVVHVLLNAARQGDWYGGFTWGPRYQALALPFWLLVLAGPQPRWVRRALVAATALGAAVNLVGAGARWPQTLAAGVREVTTFGLQGKGLGLLVGAGPGYHPAGVELLTAKIVLLTTALLLAGLVATWAVWGRPAPSRRPFAAAAVALVALQLAALSASSRREPELRTYLRDLEFLSFVWHFREPSNFVVASDVALRLGRRDEAARLAERALELAPGDERAALRLAIARADVAALERLAGAARDDEVRAAAAAHLRARPR